MARFRANGAFVIGAVKYPAGTVFADASYAQAGDVVVPGGLTIKMLSPALVPLDDGARALYAASRFRGEPPWPADGASSIG